MLEIEDEAFCRCESLRKVIVSSTSTRLGKGVFKYCIGLISVDLPEGLQVIEAYLFYGCQSLPTIKIPSSVIEIGDKAFGGCNSLSTIKIPSSVIKIGSSAFSSCKALKHVQLPDIALFLIAVRGSRTTSPINPVPLTSKIIGDEAFKGCSSLSHIRVPASIDSNGFQPFIDCRNLISIELPEGILFSADIFECNSLVNVAVTGLRESNLSDYGMFFSQLSELGRVAGGQGPRGQSEDLVHRITHRFDGSPMNKLCYYQSYYSTEDAVLQLRHLMEDDPLTAVSQVDELGMTPLHILSLAQTPNVDMLLAVMKAGHRDHIIQGRDSFGSTPMDYLCLNRSPDSTEVIRRVLRMRFDCWLGLDRPCSSKSDSMWQLVDEALAVDWSSRSREIGSVYFELAKYEQRTTILSLVELCLWKIKMDEDCCSSPEQTVTDHGYREICRINSGASVVLPHLLPFLDKLNVDDYVVSSVVSSPAELGW
eukprot:scaffold1553_cov52-Cylindrotheca_fusiformis.AAC.2